MSSILTVWEEVICEEGIYYWNTETGEVRWQLPNDDVKLSNNLLTNSQIQDPFFNDPSFSSNNNENKCFLPIIASNNDSSLQYENIDLNHISTNPISAYENVNKYRSSSFDIHSFNSERHLTNSHYSNSVNDSGLIYEFASKELIHDENGYTLVSQIRERFPNLRRSAIKKKFSVSSEELFILKDDDINQNNENNIFIFKKEDSQLITDKNIDIAQDYSYSYFKEPYHTLELIEPFDKQYQSVTEPRILNYSDHHSTSKLETTSPHKRNSNLYENVHFNDFQKLPEGWQEVQTSDGLIYYWQCQSGLTQWEFPLEKLCSSVLINSLDEQSTTQFVSLNISDHLKSHEENSLIFECEHVDVQSIHSNELIQGHCSELIERCIEKYVNLLDSADMIDRRSVNLHVAPGIFREIDSSSNIVLKAFQINRIRAWGCCKDYSRYFAFIARQSKSKEYRCFVYYCQSSSKDLTLALRKYSNCVFSINKKDKKDNIPESSSSPINLENNNDSKSFSCYSTLYLGFLRVCQTNEIEVIRQTIQKILSNIVDAIEVSIQISPSCFEIHETQNNNLLFKTEVRFISLIGLSEDSRFCGYICLEGQSFYCHCFSSEKECRKMSISMQNALGERLNDNLDCLKNTPKQNHQVSSINIKESISDFLKSKINIVSKGVKPQRTSASKSIYGIFQVQYYGSAKVSIANDKVAVQEAISYLENQSSMLTNPIVLDFQVSQGGFSLFDKGRKKFRKTFPIISIEYCLKKGHSIAFVVKDSKSGLYEAFAMGEINSSASEIIESIQKAVNNK